MLEQFMCRRRWPFDTSGHDGGLAVLDLEQMLCLRGCVEGMTMVGVLLWLWDGRRWWSGYVGGWRLPY